MTAYNIREKFSYNIASSSLDYVRNYNFNTTTISDIPVTLSNSDEKIPITVNMTTSDDWMLLTNPQTGKSVKLPEGNVVLAPASSTTIMLKIDLPADIENTPSTTIYPSITFDIKSGSMLIVAPTPPPPPDETNRRVQNTIRVPSTVSLTVGEVQEIIINVFDNAGNEEDGGDVQWEIDNENVAVLETATSETDALNKKNIRGLATGTTRLTYTSGIRKNTTEIIVTGITSSPTTSPTGGDNTCGQRCTGNEDCFGVCGSCVEGICREVNQI